MTTLNFVKQNGQYIGHGDSSWFNHQDTICTFIEKRTQKTPDAIALHFKESQITFKEANEQSNRLARYLLGCGVHPKGGFGTQITILCCLALTQ